MKDGRVVMNVYEFYEATEDSPAKHRIEAGMTCDRHGLGLRLGESIVLSIDNCGDVYLWPTGQRVGTLKMAGGRWKIATEGA